MLYQQRSNVTLNVTKSTSIFRCCTVVLLIPLFYQHKNNVVLTSSLQHYFSNIIAWSLGHFIINLVFKTLQQHHGGTTVEQYGGTMSRWWKTTATQGHCDLVCLLGKDMKKSTLRSIAFYFSIVFKNLIVAFSCKTDKLCFYLATLLLIHWS